MIFLLFLTFLSKSEDFEVDGFTYRILNNETKEVQVINCSIISELLIIPNSVIHDGTNYNVISISTKTFSTTDITQYTTLYLPFNISDIEESTFQDFTNLNMIGYIDENLHQVNDTLPPKLINLNRYVFQNCRSIQKLDLNNVENINDRAFEEAIMLRNLTMRFVRIIGSYSLGKIQSLTSLELPKTLTEIQSFAFAKTAIVNLTGEVPNLAVIDNGFTYCSDLQMIPALSGIIEIGNQAFAGCRMIREIHCSEKLDSIYSGAFSGCSSLEIFTTGSKNVFISPEAFMECSMLRNFDFSCAVGILNDAFLGCSSLEVVDMSESSMDEFYPIFGECNLKRLVMPPNLTFVDSTSFLECNVTDLRFSGTNGKLDLSRLFYNYQFDLCEVSFAPSCDVDLYNTFVQCSSLVKVVLPKTSYILDQTFVLCRNLETVENLGYCTKLNYTFNNCYKLANLDSFDSLLELGIQSFTKCLCLVSLPAFPLLTKIEKECFMNCEKLTSFQCGMNLNEIGSKAFQGCVSLKNIKFIKAPSIIGKDAFLNCASLESVIIEQSSLQVQPIVIENSAFLNCSSLSNFEFKNWPIVEIGSFAFFGCPLSKEISFVGTPNSESNFSISSFAFNSLEIRSIDFRFDALSLNLDKDSFANCTKVNCVMVDKKHHDEVSSVFVEKIINGSHCPNYIKTHMGFLIAVTAGSAILLIILIIAIVCIVKKRKQKKLVPEEPLLTQK